MKAEEATVTTGKDAEKRNNISTERNAGFVGVSRTVRVWQPSQ